MLRFSILPNGRNPKRREQAKTNNIRAKWIHTRERSETELVGSALLTWGLSSSVLFRAREWIQTSLSVSLIQSNCSSPSLLDFCFLHKAQPLYNVVVRRWTSNKNAKWSVSDFLSKSENWKTERKKKLFPGLTKLHTSLFDLSCRHGYRANEFICIEWWEIDLFAFHTCSSSSWSSLSLSVCCFTTAALLALSITFYVLKCRNQFSA